MLHFWPFIGLLYSDNNSNTISDIPTTSSHSQTLKVTQTSTYLSPSLSSSSPPLIHEPNDKIKILALCFGLVFGVPVVLFLISCISIIPCYLKRARHPPNLDQTSNELTESSYSMNDLELQNDSSNIIVNAELPPPQYETIQEPAPAYCKGTPPSYSTISEGDDEIVEVMNNEN